MPPDYDVIVVGAGPAGASAALYCARKGLKVLMLDKKRFPRDKVCGDTLSSQSLGFLEDLGLLDSLLDVPHVQVEKVSYFSPGGNHITVPLLQLDKDLPVKGVVCRRVIFDDMLFLAAKKEVEIMDWCRVRDVLIEKGRAVGVRAELGGHREYEFTSKLVIGADGPHSIVGRAMGVSPYLEYRALAARAYYRCVTGMVGSLEIHFLDDLLPGYFWIYPTESNMTNVGFTVPYHSLKSMVHRPFAAMQAALDSENLRERFEYAEKMGSTEVRLLPVGNSIRRVHGNGFMLVGDAAGLVNPCSAEGIANAMASAKVAAEVAAEVCDGTDYSREALKKYPQRLWTELGPVFRMSDRLLELRTPKAIESLVKSAKRRPHNAGWISGILLGSALPSEELSSLLRYLDYFAR